MTPGFDRPAWSARTSGRYTGRYPLAVESFALARVAELLLGVTTEAPHARYFSLHAFVAVESERRRLRPVSTGPRRLPRGARTRRTAVEHQLRMILESYHPAPVRL